MKLAKKLFFTFTFTIFINTAFGQDIPKQEWNLIKKLKQAHQNVHQYVILPLYDIIKTTGKDFNEKLKTYSQNVKNLWKKPISEQLAKETESAGTNDKPIIIDGNKVWVPVEKKKLPINHPGAQDGKGGQQRLPAGEFIVKDGGKVTVKKPNSQTVYDDITFEEESEDSLEEPKSPPDSLKEEMQNLLVVNENLKPVAVLRNREFRNQLINQNFY